MVATTEERTSRLPAKQQELAVIDYSADAGAGMEGATAEAFAIPFLTVLQKGSPQVDETSGAAIDGAKQGMFFENVTGKLFDGKAGVILIPCAYKRVFIKWGPREGNDGAMFRGELPPEKVDEMRANGLIKDLDGRLYAPMHDGTVNDKRSERFVDTRNHYCLLKDDSTGAVTQVLLSLSSSQLKKSRALMAMLASVKKSGPKGLYSPPTFAMMIKATTLPESNEKGSWMGIKFELAGDVTDPDIYATAKAFNQSVAKGTTIVNYEATSQDEPARDNAF